MADINVQIKDGQDNVYPKAIPLLRRSISRDSITQNPGENYWTLADTFAGKSGYSRKVLGLFSSDGSVVCTGWYLSNDQIVVRTFNLSSSQKTFTLTCEAMYIRDDLSW